jgi:hypothetical protein
MPEPKKMDNPILGILAMAVRSGQNIVFSLHGCPSRNRLPHHEGSAFFTLDDLTMALIQHLFRNPTKIEHQNPTK